MTNIKNNEYYLQSLTEYQADLEQDASNYLAEIEYIGDDFKRFMERK